MNAGSIDAPLKEIMDEPVDWKFKSFPAVDGVTIGSIADQKWRVADGDFELPVLLIRERALMHNVRRMSEYRRANNVDLAPHGKTAMSPQLAHEQVEAGAFAITVATVAQARVFRRFGARRLIIANEIIGRREWEWIVAEREADPEFCVMTLVDSDEAVDQISAVLDDLAPSRPVPVLLELGYADGRAGCRSSENAMAVARRVRRTKHLSLCGVEGFEGVMPGRDRAVQESSVREYLAWAKRVVTLLDGDGLFDESCVVVSFGGSIFFDSVVDVLGGAWAEGPQTRLILRSGCYVTHDLGFYEQNSPWSRLDDPLQPALELWACVLSRPESDLAIVGFGKRDTSHDLGLPVPLTICRNGVSRSGRALSVLGLNDQHATVRVPTDEDVRVGDLIAFGVSHPCTALDKWPLIPLVDDNGVVTGAYRTFF